MLGFFRWCPVVAALVVVSSSLAAVPGPGLSVALTGLEVAFTQATPVAVSVTVNAPSQPLVIFKPASKSPRITLNTQVSPAGGTFTWQIASGQNKVKFVGGTHGRTASLQPIAPSTAMNDVVVSVTYAAGPQAAGLPVTLTGQDTLFAQATGVAVATAYLPLTVQRPTSAMIVGGPKQDNKKRSEAYALLYDFQVADQFGQIIRAEGMPVREVKSRTWSNHVGWWPFVVFDSDETRTDDNGVWEDRLALRSFMFFPTDFVARVQQSDFVAGWPVGMFNVTYRSGSAVMQSASAAGE